MSTPAQLLDVNALNYVDVVDNIVQLFVRSETNIIANMYGKEALIKNKTAASDFNSVHAFVPDTSTRSKSNLYSIKSVA